MIVIEGPDLAGKSTLAEALFQRFRKLPNLDMPPMARHFTKPPNNFNKYWGYRRCVQRDVIIDRFHMSHIAYRLMDGEDHDLTPMKYEMIDAAITNAGGIVVLLCPSEKTTRERWNAMPADRQEMYTLPQVLKVRSYFEEMFRKRYIMTKHGEYRFKIDICFESPVFTTDMIATKVMEMWLDRQQQYDEVMRSAKPVVWETAL